MKFLNRERSIKYLGFDDKWFIVAGVFILSFIMDFLLTNSFGRGLPFRIAMIGWSVSFFFSLANWFVIREVMIQLRKRFPELKDDLKRIIIFFLAIVLSVFLVDFLGTTFLTNLGDINFNALPKSKLVQIILVSMMTMAIYEAIYYYIRLKVSIREEEQSKQAIVQAQLDVLRNQAQPHFFFNTLTTLRDIIDQNSKEEAKEFVDKLSDVYRFILEAGNRNLIPLKDEIRFAKSYLHIQSERFGNNLNVEWDVSLSDMNRMIVPMSLQLLLENAIKHNVVSKSKPLFIKVNSFGGRLVVTNPIQAKTSKISSTKLGLENIKSRYHLICKEVVEVSDLDGEFRVSLPLLITNHKSEAYANSDH